MKKIFLLSLLVLSACNMQQDPLADYPDSIRNALPPDATGPVIQKPIDTDALLIDANDLYSVKENGTLDITISGRVLLPNTNFKIEIENLTDFPGAKFDPVKNQFLWKVPNTTVVGNNQIVKELHVLMYTDSTPVYSNRKNVSVLVMRDVETPVVERVVSLPSVVYEDSSAYFQVFVRSSDSVAPKLTVLSIRTGKDNGSGFVSINGVPTQVSGDPTLWQFSMTINTSKVDVTPLTQSSYFGLQAFNQFGDASLIKEQFFSLYTSLETPKWSWRAPLTFFADKPNTYSFIVFDPREEGKITVTNTCTTTAPAASCVCNSYEVYYYSMICTITWTPTQADLNKNFNFSFIGKNGSPIAGDTRFSPASFTGVVSVKAP